MNERILALRGRETGFLAQAAAKRGELRNDTPAADAERIEREHAALVEQAKGAKQELDTEQRKLSATYIDLAVRAGLPASLVDEHLQKQTPEKEFRAMIIDKLAQRDDAHRTFPHVTTGHVSVLQDEADTRRRAMADAITARLEQATATPGVKVTVPEHARAYAGMALVEIAAECCGWRGQLRTARQVSDMLQRAFHTTSDFPGIFVDAANARLLARYQVAMPTYRRFAALYTAADFRPTNVVRAGDFPTLQPITEAGEIKSGTFSESKELFRVHPYGVKFNISRTMIINDNLRALDQMIGSYGDRVMDWENVKVFELLKEGSGAGPVLLTDNKRVFHTDHGNLAQTPSVIDVTNVGIGRAAMMKQTTLDGIQANFQPAVLLCGPDKITQAEQLVTSITPATTGNSVPESIRRLVPVGDGNISGNAWYLFADPAVAPCFVYGYLEGFEGPRLATEEPFGVQGLGVKLEHDFGAAAVDYRGGHRNAGA